MSSTETQQVPLSPHTQEPYAPGIRAYPSLATLEEQIANAKAAQKEWSALGLDQRIAIGWDFIVCPSIVSSVHDSYFCPQKEFQAQADEIPLELTLQMGRPVSQTPGEIRGLVERATYLLNIAKDALADVSLKGTDKPGFKRWIKRVPLGVVFVIAPWKSVFPS